MSPASTLVGSRDNCLESAFFRPECVNTRDGGGKFRGYCCCRRRETVLKNNRAGRLMETLDDFHSDLGEITVLSMVLLMLRIGRFIAALHRLEKNNKVHIVFVWGEEGN